MSMLVETFLHSLPGKTRTRTIFAAHKSHHYSISGADRGLYVGGRTFIQFVCENSDKCDDRLGRREIDADDDVEVGDDNAECVSVSVAFFPTPGRRSM